MELNNEFRIKRIFTPIESGKYEKVLHFLLSPFAFPLSEREEVVIKNESS